jgi:hypothetical protein
MALDLITHEDLIYRLNKLKCCFATSAAELVDKQRFGKECKDQLCNLKLLGAYIEMIECYSPLPCNCHEEWVADGSKNWSPTTTYNYGDVIRFIPRATANGGEYLYLRWQSTSALIPPAGVWTSPGGYQTPTLWGFTGIGVQGWSVCGHVKQAWQARGSLIWDDTITYGWGDIVKFQGGGPGVDQTKRGRFFISIADPNATGFGFHESEHWVELECFRKQEM